MLAVVANNEFLNEAVVLDELHRGWRPWVPVQCHQRQDDCRRIQMVIQTNDNYAAVVGVPLVEDNSSAIVRRSRRHFGAGPPSPQRRR